MEKVASTVHVNTKVLFTVFIVTSAGFVRSDFNKGRKGCGDQLADFSACLPFVGGKAKSPSPTCCSSITKEGSKTRKCLCLLVKDRNEPRHGFKMNATLALSLPSVRHAPATVSDCPALLNLPPNSTDAQVVEQLAANSGGNNSTAVAAVVPSSSNNTVKGRRWRGMVCAVSLWLVISL